jgi:hypothetical protein
MNQHKPLCFDAMHRDKLRVLVAVSPRQGKRGLPFGHRRTHGAGQGKIAFRLRQIVGPVNEASLSRWFAGLDETGMGSRPEFEQQIIRDAAAAVRSVRQSGPRSARRTLVPTVAR